MILKTNQFRYNAHLFVNIIMTRHNLNILIQYLLPQHALSRLAGWLSNRRWLWFKNWQINFFIKRYNVDINAALLPTVEDYPTFNSFFTRKLKPNLRPLPAETNAIISPADGCISQLGNINHDQLFQAKGFHFTSHALLGSTEHAEQFQDGSFITIYLSPKDYHRVHMPFTGKLRETIYIPGKLFSVNQQTVRTVPQLFSRNERLVCLFDTDFGPMAIILVGAMLVGSINTAWDSQSPQSKKIVRKTYSQSSAIILNRGDELGYFKMGSTVIALFPKKKIHWAPNLGENSLLQMGEFLGKTLTS